MADLFKCASRGFDMIDDHADDCQTLDFAAARFRDYPSRQTAQAYTTIAREYANDGMIEVSEADAIELETKTWHD